MTDGIWSLKTALAIKNKGIDVIVLAPTPWIPKWMAVTPTLRGWAEVADRCEIDDMMVYYSKCPHYPKRGVRNHVYNVFPFFETSAVYHWMKKTVSFLMDQYPFQLTHANFMFPSGYIGYRIKQHYAVPFIFHERGVRRLETAIEKRRLRGLYSKVIQHSDLVITPSQKMAEIIRKQFRNDGIVTVVRDVGDIDISDGLAKEKPEKYKDKKVIVSVGALIERKGHEVLIQAVNKIRSRIPDIKCLIIGTGQQQNHLKNLVNSLRLTDIVELCGALPHIEVLGIMSWCDVFVLPSWNEAFGTVNAEAMTFGKPIIGCWGEGISEVIEDGVQGLLVKKQDVESLAEAIVKILTDRSLASHMGIKSKELSVRELNYNYISSQIIDLYNRVLSQYDIHP